MSIRSAPIATPTRTSSRDAKAATSELPCCPSVLSAPLGPDDADELAKGFAALADPVRLRLLSLVAEAGEICSCDLEGPLGRSQPTISHHTKVLAEAGLLAGEKRGRWTWWKVAPDQLEALRRVLGG